MKKRKSKKKLDKRSRKHLIILAMLVIIGGFLYFTQRAPQGWKEAEVYPGYTLYHPADWQTSTKYGYALFTAFEQDDQTVENFRLTSRPTSPISRTAKGAGSYQAVWIAKLNKDGNVSQLIKNPVCTEHSKPVSIAGGYFVCDIEGNNPVLAVAVDITDHTKLTILESQKLDGRLYDTFSIECTKGASTDYDLEKTCEHIIRSFQKLPD